MKPPDFHYHRPEHLTEALDLLGKLDDVKLLAGGQSLVPAMNFRQTAPSTLIDLNRISELSGIRLQQGTLVFGAMTRQRDLETSPTVRNHCPLLTEALRFVGHLPTRTRGTVGGSLAFADPLAELPTAALALQAELVIASGNGAGTRTVTADEFFHAAFTTTLGPVDLLTEVHFPALGEGDGSAFEETAVVRSAVYLHVDKDQVCRRARIALAGTAHCPDRARDAEKLLVGMPATGDTWNQAADTAVADINPPDEPDAPAGYRRDLARELTRRALERAANRARKTWKE